MAPLPSPRRAGLGVTYLAGEVAGRGIAFLFFILLARLIPVTDFAFVNLYVTLANLAAILLGLGLPNAIVRFYFTEWAFERVIGTILVVVALVAGAVFAVGLVLGEVIADFLRVPAPLVRLATVGGAVIAIRQCWLSSLRARQMSKVYAATQFAEPLLMVAGITAYLLITGNLRYGPVVGAYTAATACVAVVAYWRWRTAPGLTPDRKLVQPLLAFSWPLIFHGAANYALGTYDQVLVNQVLGSEAAGIYAYAYRFGMSMLLVSTAFSAVWMPLFLEQIRRPGDAADLDKLAQTYGNILIIGGVLLMIILPAVAWFVGGAAYLDGVRLIPLVLYGYLWFILYTLAVGYAMHHRKTLSIAIGTIVTLAINVGLNLLLLPVLGILAAAIATVISFVTLFVVQYLIARRFQPTIRFGRLSLKVAVVSVVPIVITALTY